MPASHGALGGVSTSRGGGGQALIMWHKRSGLGGWMGGCVLVVSGVLLVVHTQGVAGGSKEEARAMVQQAMKLNKAQDAKRKGQLLQQAALLDPLNADAVREVAVAAAQDLLGPRLPDDPGHALTMLAMAALQDYRRVAHLDLRRTPPQLCDMLVNLGHQLEGRDRPLMAQEVYQAALRHDPSHANTIGSLYKVREWLCDWEGGGGRVKAFAHLMTLVRQQLGQKGSEEPGVRAVQTSLQPLTALSQDVDARTQLYIARAWTAAYIGGMHKAAEGNRFLMGAKVAKPKDGRITVAYISADLRGHAVSHQMMSVFKHHHKSSKVRVFILNTFAGNPGVDGAQIKGYVDQWVDVAQVQGSTLAAQISNTLRVHIVVDLAGHTFGHRLSALAQRPAPVAMTYLGYASTTGAAFMDYMISDAVVSPPDLAPAYSESLALLPHTFYPLNTQQGMAQGDTNDTRQHHGLPTTNTSGAFVWACFNRNLKIKPDIWKVWMRLLRKNPSSVLWLRRFHIRVQDNLKKHALKANIQPDRLVFAGRL